MALAAGTRLGSYEIVALVGAGGMGEVYRARDPRLGRDVAVKILPPSVAADADRLRRFELEARAAGRLNHPNILVVHDIGTAEGSPYLVSELLEGDTLRDRLKSGRPPVSTAVDFALQIARGLQAAHEKGIVHRDLKPENLFVTTDGRIKILDFGLAKLTAPASGVSAASTATVPATAPGVVMGTAGYMSPEQVRGDEADHRADIFAFGAILHELLTGARAFTGASSMDVMSAILRADAPDAIDSNPALSPALSRVLRHCLEKQPSARFQSAADLCFAIETLSPSGALATPRAEATHAAPAVPGWSPRAGWIAAGVLALAMVPLAMTAFRDRDAPSTGRAFVGSVAPPQGSVFDTFVVSPDGRWLAFTGGGARRSQLWIRTLDEPVVSTMFLEGTEGASNPFWSPDSRSIGFFAGNQLKVVEIDGGHPRALCDVSDNRGGTWSRDDVIVFAPDIAGGLYRVSARDGGAKVPLTRLDAGRQEGTHRWPHFLPDGRHILYFVRSGQSQHTGVYVASIDETTGRFLGPTSSHAVFAPPGFLLFVRDRALMTQRFDTRTLTLAGEPASLVPRVGYSLALNRGSFSVSDNGVLVYGGSEERRPVWLDRKGTPQDAVAPAESYTQIWLSPDDTGLAFERPDARTGANDVFVLELDRGGIATRFTTHPGSDSRPVWLPSGRIAWGSNRSGVYDLYQKAARGAGQEELLLQSGESKVPTDGSPDGRFLLYTSVDSKSKTSLHVLPLVGEKTPFSLLDSGFNEAQARFSPDGRWIAYTIDKDGTFEIYVIETQAVLPGRREPASSRRANASLGVRASSNGGTQPMWRRDGKTTELYYLAPDRRLMAVSLKDAGRPQPGVPQVLFDTRLPDFGPAFQSYAVSADGRRFLVLAPTEESPAATVVFNWTSALDRGSR